MAENEGCMIGINGEIEQLTNEFNRVYDDVNGTSWKFRNLEVSMILMLITFLIC